MEKSKIDLWASFLSHEKLEPKLLDEESTMKLIELCQQLATMDGPYYRPYKKRLETRSLIVNTAMSMGFDLLALKHKFTGKRLIGRGLLDAWNQAYQKRFGSTIGTSGSKEASRRDVKTHLKGQNHEF